MVRLSGGGSFLLGGNSAWQKFCQQKLHFTKSLFASFTRCLTVPKIYFQKLILCQISQKTHFTIHRIPICLLHQMSPTLNAFFVKHAEWANKFLRQSIPGNQKTYFIKSLFLISFLSRCLSHIKDFRSRTKHLHPTSTLG